MSGRRSVGNTCGCGDASGDAPGGRKAVYSSRRRATCGRRQHASFWASWGMCALSPCSADAVPARCSASTRGQLRCCLNTGAAYFIRCKGLERGDAERRRVSRDMLRGDSEICSSGAVHLSKSLRCNIGVFSWNHPSWSVTIFSFLGSCHGAPCKHDNPLQEARLN